MAKERNAIDMPTDLKIAPTKNGSNDKRVWDDEGKEEVVEDENEEKNCTNVKNRLMLLTYFLWFCRLHENFHMRSIIM